MVPEWMKARQMWEITGSGWLLYQSPDESLARTTFDTILRELRLHRQVLRDDGNGQTTLITFPLRLFQDGHLRRDAQRVEAGVAVVDYTEKVP